MDASINPADNHSIHKTRDSIDDDLDELIARITRNKAAASLALQENKEAQLAFHSPAATTGMNPKQTSLPTGYTSSESGDEDSASDAVDGNNDDEEENNSSEAGPG